MRNGYKVLWTENALQELNEVYDYISTKWTKRELTKLSLEIERSIMLLEKDPFLFKIYKDRKDVRIIYILKLNSLVYRIKDNQVEILSFFSNRQNPNRIKL